MRTSAAEAASSTAFNAALKRCSTQTKAHPKSKFAQNQNFAQD
jgi:hypothetical protein